MSFQYASGLRHGDQYISPRNDWWLIVQSVKIRRKVTIVSLNACGEEFTERYNFNDKLQLIKEHK